MILKVSWDYLSTLSFGLSQFYGHGSWLVCEVALEDPRPHYMILEVSWDGLSTLSFELSQFHGHGSSLVCEVALRAPNTYRIIHFNDRGEPAVRHK